MGLSLFRRFCRNRLFTSSSVVEDGRLFPSVTERQSVDAVEDGPLSLLCRFGSNLVAEQSLTVEDEPLSPPRVRQQSSVAEVEDGFVSLPSILSQSSVHEQF